MEENQAAAAATSTGRSCYGFMCIFIFVQGTRSWAWVQDYYINKNPTLSKKILVHGAT
jgi:hypothetical protein